MLIGVTGRMGSGKTLSMTALGESLSLSMNTPLYANYTLLRAAYSHIHGVDDLWRAERGVVLLDELWLTMDSRMWKDNVALTRWIMMTRKKDLITIYSTQHPKQIDIRVRQATEWLVYCEKKNGRISLSWVDYQYGIIGKKMTIERPQEIYSHYNTYEIMAALKQRSGGSQSSNFDRGGGSGGGGDKKGRICDVPGCKFPRNCFKKPGHSV